MRLGSTGSFTLAYLPSTSRKQGSIRLGSVVGLCFLDIGRVSLSQSTVQREDSLEAGGYEWT